MAEGAVGATSNGYQPRPAGHFVPERIVLAKGSCATAPRRGLAEAICAAYPAALVISQPETPHNRVDLGVQDMLDLHYRGKTTLVLGEHQSSVRCSDEEGNTCPNYWHFSPYGFCPYDCQYCYLAGTPGVRYSPTVKVFVNLPEILEQVRQVAKRLSRPTAFYLGKLQDGLALDPLTGYSRTIVPFFAAQPQARMILLTKCADASNLLDLDHRGHTILSWSLLPPEVSRLFEANVPPSQERIAAMQRCAAAGYPIRAVLMPVIPMDDWPGIYDRFLEELLTNVALDRLTIGGICSYATAMSLTNRKLGPHNAISALLGKHSNHSADGRARYPLDMRLRVYRSLLSTIRRLRPQLPVGLCLEERETFEALGMASNIGCCNCVL